MWRDKALPEASVVNSLQCILAPWNLDARQLTAKLCRCAPWVPALEQGAT